MICALKIAEDKRILYACRVLPNGKYDSMPVVETIPDGDISDYLYVNDEYIYDPLPEPEQPEERPTQEERISALEQENAYLKETLEILLSGATEEVSDDDESVEETGV